MKAASLYRHMWVGVFMCALFLAATGVAYAGAAGTCLSAKPKNPAQQEQVQVQKELATPKKVVPVVNSKGSVAKKTEVTKSEAKPAPAKQTTEAKKEGASANFFSFSFLYYLFYKTNFAETTNTAVRVTFSSLISTLLE